MEEPAVSGVLEGSGESFVIFGWCPSRCTWGIVSHRQTTDFYPRIHCLTMRQPIRAVVYLRILNRKRWAARQLLFDNNAGSGLHTTFKKITDCHRSIVHCVGDVIMSARSSNSSSRHALSVVWCSHTIPQVGLDGWCQVAETCIINDELWRGMIPNVPRPYATLVHRWSTPVRVNIGPET
jgi:hypothetical protein